MAVRGVCCQIYRNNAGFCRRLLFCDGPFGSSVTVGASRANQLLEVSNNNGTASVPTLTTRRRSAHSLAAALQPSICVYRTRHYVTSLTQNCWKCGTHLDPAGEQYFCECGVIQPPKEERNFFEVLGIERSFDINTMVLTKRFRDLQKGLHPDRFTQKSEEERHFSAEQSSTVNRAYQTVLKPLPRGLYLLELEGHSIEDGDIQQDPEFLMEIMEFNEAIAETTSPEEMKRLRKQNRRSLNELTVKVSQAFSADDVQEAKELLSQLKYYANIDDKISELQRDGF